MIKIKLHIFLFLLIPLFVSGNLFGAIYYIDAQNGSNKSNGLSPQNAWRSLAKASTINYRAGDQILLKAGQTFTDSLALKSVSGAPAFPIVISSFGGGRAIISSGDSVAVLANNCNFLVIKNLIFKGSGRLNGNNTSGYCW